MQLNEVFFPHTISLECCRKVKIYLEIKVFSLYVCIEINLFLVFPLDPDSDYACSAEQVTQVWKQALK